MGKPLNQILNFALRKICWNMSFLWHVFSFKKDRIAESALRRENGGQRKLFFILFYQVLIARVTQTSTKMAF